MSEETSANEERTILDVAHSRLKAKLPGIDAIDLPAIIGIILQILAACSKPAQVKQMATKRPLFASIAVNRAMRQNGLRPLSPDGRRIHGVIMDLGAEAQENEIADMMAYAQRD